jgi:uncharacterized protein with ACT and thioredoxin-like domain
VLELNQQLAEARSVAALGLELQVAEKRDTLPSLARLQSVKSEILRVNIDSESKKTYGQRFVTIGDKRRLCVAIGGLVIGNHLLAIF